MSTASTLAPAKRCAVVIAFWPVPQPATRTCVTTFENISVGRPDCVRTQRGYGFASYCACTLADTALRAVLTEGISAAIRRSSAGSSTWRRTREAIDSLLPSSVLRGRYAAYAAHQ